MTLRYFRPASLTWWAGVFLVLVGAVELAAPYWSWLNELAALTALLSGSGGSNPATLIGSGLGLIGVRDKLERVFRGEPG